jgi:hypothetical protein
MNTAFRKGAAVLLALAVGLGPLPAPARADDAVAKIKKVVHDDLKEVAYPTKLVQLVTDQRERDASKNMEVAAGEAVLTRTANTFVQVSKEDRDACLYSNTFVRFDDLNLWLLRSGAMYVVNKRGRLEVVAEALGRVLVGSSVLLRSDGSELFAFVTEGRVVLEAGAHTLSLGPGQAGRIPMGGVPERAPLDPEEQAQMSKELKATEKAMKGGGGGGWLAAALGLAVIGTAVAVSRGGGGDRGHGGGTGGGDRGDGGTGGDQALPDLAPVADPAGGPCRFDNRGNLVVPVRNLGRGSTAASIAEVRLRPAGRTRTVDGPGASPQRLRTSELPPGGTTELLVPTGDFQVGGYSVTVDRDGRVRESNEANNTATVTCPAIVG